MTELDTADGPSPVAKAITNKIWLSRDQAETMARDIDAALHSAHEAGKREGIEAAAEMRERAADDDPRWIMEGVLAPTWDEVKCAGLAWCNSLERETFLSDETYFRNMWTALPGLKLYVAREIAKRVALSEARAAAILPLSPSPTGGWLPMDSAPKDGTRILLAGQWSDPSSPSFGQWIEEIFSWSSIHSDGDPAKCEWWSGLRTMKNWAVEWKLWQPLPAPPADGEGSR